MAHALKLVVKLMMSSDLRDCHGSAADESRFLRCRDAVFLGVVTDVSDKSDAFFALNDRVYWPNDATS